MGERIVIIGANAAGMSAASQAKRVNSDLEVIVLEKSPYISYGECGMPYYIGGVIDNARKLFVLSVEAAREKRGIDVRINNEVTSIDIEKKELTVVDRQTDKGEYKQPYDRLVIATGAKSIYLNISGSDLNNIFHLKFFDDAKRIVDFLDREKPGKAVVIGAGYIGLEMTENLRHRGIDVTIVEMLPTVMGATEPDVHQVILEELERNGVKVMLETRVEAYGGEGGKVKRVITDKGEIEADFVLESVGIIPETSLARKAGIKLGDKGGIVVDDYMRTNIRDVFSAGDCAEVRHVVSGRYVYIPLALNANRGGRYAGNNAAVEGSDSGNEPLRGYMKFPGTLGSAVAKIFDVEVGKVGLSSVDARRLGYDFVTTTVKSKTKAGYWPEHPDITLTFIADRKTRKLLGAQLAGGSGAALRIDTVATALFNRMTVDEIKEMDLAYAPPFSPSWDPILIAAGVMAKKL